MIGKVAILALLAVAAVAEYVPVHRNGRTIPNQYIVVLNDDIEIENGRAFAASVGASRFLNIGEFKAFSGVFSNGLLRKLRQRTDLIKYIEADQIVSVNYEQGAALASLEQKNPPSWGLDRVDQRNLPLDNLFRYYNTSGSGVDIYIIDTGILTSHTDFGKRAVSGYNFHDDTSDATDDNGHGTHCAGTTAGTSYGLAKGANLIAVKTLGRLGSGSLANVAAGVEWAAQKHQASKAKKSVANMSLGGGASTVLDEAVRAAITQGLIVVAASGNSDDDACDYSPARVSTAITVNASTNVDRRASFSNYGTCTTLFAPGQDITSAWIGGNTATRTISGTSMACPHVVGAVALLLGEDGTFTPAAAKTAIINAATTGVITDIQGSPNRLLFANYA